jgi:exonuclease SbcD
MKILHTADWHLGARLGRFDRSDDLRRAVGRIMTICEEDEVDVLLIAGDLFDSTRRMDDVRDAVDDLKKAVQPFLRRGGTILAITGNHDGEIFCQTFQHALSLADPSSIQFGERLSPGRFHLATRPTFHRLTDRDGQDVQFVLMPYPTATRYLDDAATSFQGSAEGKHRRLREEFTDLLRRMRAHQKHDTALHSVLVAHLCVQGASLPGGYVVTENDGVVCPPEDLGEGWAYVALGDIHKPQSIGGRPHVRYSGSIERLNFDEREDDKGVILLDIGPEGLRGTPIWRPLESTPFLDVVITDPSTELDDLETRYPEAARALARCRVTYTAGVHDRDAIHRQIDKVFPRCYSREIVEAGRQAVGSADAPDGGAPRREFRDTVIDFLKPRLEDHPHSAAVLNLADELIGEVPQ